MSKHHRVRRPSAYQICLFLIACSLGYVFGVLSYLSFRESESVELTEQFIGKEQLIRQRLPQKRSDEVYENFTQWNRTLCSPLADRRGPHQKVIAISIFGKESKVVDNPMYSWETSVLKFLQPLAEEIRILLPQWILRVYVDFTGSQQFQRDFFQKFSNIDICDMEKIPMFGSSVPSFLPGRMWRFLPIFDPYVDYLLSRDLDSPITPREVDTINMWLSNDQEKNFFYIARDHKEHAVPILAGLWGAATRRARKRLFDIFQPMLLPATRCLYKDRDDQLFLSDFVWKYVKKNSLTFDSYSCRQFGGQPFPSQRPKGICYLGCIRPCCENTTEADVQATIKPCPIGCRPKEHLDWIYC